TAGAPISMELNEAGVTRIVSMTPRFPVSGHATDPALAATNFLAAYHDVFQLDRSDLSSFTVVGVHPEPPRNMNHVILQRNYNGIPVYQGLLSIHMDGGNGVFTVLGNDFYKIDPPNNSIMLSPSEAALAAGHQLGVQLALTELTSEARGAVFTAP